MPSGYQPEGDVLIDELRCFFFLGVWIDYRLCKLNQRGISGSLFIKPAAGVSFFLRPGPE